MDQPLVTISSAANGWIASSAPRTEDAPRAQVVNRGIIYLSGSELATNRATGFLASVYYFNMSEAKLVLAGRTMTLDHNGYLDGTVYLGPWILSPEKDAILDASGLLFPLNGSLLLSTPVGGAKEGKAAGYLWKRGLHFVGAETVAECGTVSLEIAVAPNEKADQATRIDPKVEIEKDATVRFDDKVALLCLGGEIRGPGTLELNNSRATLYGTVLSGAPGASPLKFVATNGTRVIFGPYPLAGGMMPMIDRGASVTGEDSTITFDASLVALGMQNGSESRCEKSSGRITEPLGVRHF